MSILVKLKLPDTSMVMVNSSSSSAVIFNNYFIKTYILYNNVHLLKNIYSQSILQKGSKREDEKLHSNTILKLAGLFKCVFLNVKGKLYSYIYTNHR